MRIVSRAYSHHEAERKLPGNVTVVTEDQMHASLAFVNAAGTAEHEQLPLLNRLWSSSAAEPKSEDEQAEEEDRAEPATKPEGFQNDPNDPKNPNEVRERSLKEIKR